MRPTSPTPNGSTQPGDDWLASLADRDDEPTPTPAPAVKAPAAGTSAPAATRRTAAQPAKKQDDWLDAYLESDGTGRPAQPEPISLDSEDEPTPFNATSMPAGRKRNRAKFVAVCALGLLGIQTAGGVAYLTLYQARPQPTLAGEPAAAQTNPAPVPTASAEVIVSAAGDGQFQEIGEAVKKAAPGTRIKVKPGTYKESVVIDKSVELVGDGTPKSVVIDGGGRPALDLRDSATVRGLVLKRGPGVDAPESAAVFVRKGRPVIDQCEVTSEAQFGISVAGPDAAPVIRGGEVHHTKGIGVGFGDHARGTVENLSVSHTGGHGLSVEGGANPFVRGCTIQHAQGVGLRVAGASQGVFEDVDVSHSDKSNVVAAVGSRPVFRGCTVHKGVANGAYCNTKAVVLFERCKFLANGRDQVVLESESEAVLVGCDVRDGAKRTGVLVADRAKLTVLGGEVTNHPDAEVMVAQGGGAVLRGVRLVGGNVGLFVGELSPARKPGEAAREEPDPPGGRSRVLVEDCEIERHGLSGVMVRRGDAVFRRCKVRDNTGVGARVMEKADAVFLGCELEKNRGGDWKVEGDGRATGSGNKPALPAGAAPTPPAPRVDPPTEPAADAAGPGRGCQPVSPAAVGQASTGPCCRRRSMTTSTRSNRQSDEAGGPSPKASGGA